MRLRRFVLIFVLGLVPATLQAATEFPGGLVPMDIVREFTSGTLYKSLPDGFPPISLPAGLDVRLVGSTSESYNQKVVLRTALSREALYEQLRLALSAQGWVDLSTTTLSSFLRFCHDQYGTLSINMNTSSGGSRVDVNRSTFPNSSTCREQQVQADTNKGWNDFYNARFPTLEVPVETVTTTPTPYILRSDSSSSSGSRIEINRKGDIEVPRASAATVHEHFARQMANQGWMLDSSGIGARGTGDFYGIDVRFQSPPSGSSGFGFFNSSTF